MRRPSAKTTLSARTASRVTPYFAHRRPPAPVAMLPPTVEIARLAGSGANQSPRVSRRSLKAPLITPGSTTASRSGSLISWIRVIPRVDSTISPAPPSAPPASPVPAPRVTTGVPVAVAIRMTVWTSSVERADTTAIGAASDTCPDLSVRAAARSASVVDTASPRASRRASRTFGAVIAAGRFRRPRPPGPTSGGRGGPRPRRIPRPGVRSARRGPGRGRGCW